MIHAFDVVPKAGRGILAEMLNFKSHQSQAANLAYPMSVRVVLYRRQKTTRRSFNGQREDATGKLHILARESLALSMLSVVVAFARRRRGTNESLECNQWIESHRGACEDEMGLPSKVTFDYSRKLVFEWA